MTQALDLTIASTATGTTQRVELNDIMQALATLHEGSSRPTYLPATGMWLKTLTATTVALYLYDGTIDVLLGTFDSTTSRFTPSGQLPGFANNSAAKSSNYTLINSDYGKIITADASVSGWTLAIQSWATLSPGWFCIVQRVDSSVTNTLTIDPNASETINGATSSNILVGLHNAMIIIRSTTANTFYGLFLGNPSLYAPLASPVFTGIPQTTTASIGTSTTQIASTAFLIANRGIRIIRRQLFTSTNVSLTYTPHSNMIFCKVILQAAGGSGSGSSGGVAGGDSFFRLGTSVNLLTALGGGSSSTTSIGGTGGTAFDDGSGGSYVKNGQDGESGGSGRSGKGGNSALGFGARAQIITATGGLTNATGRLYGAGGAGEGGNTGGGTYGGGGGGGNISKFFTRDQIVLTGTKTFFIGAAATPIARQGSNGVGIVVEYCTS